MTSRQQAAQLIEAVLDERATAQWAINRWPEPADGLPDPSLDAAYQALWHFEADEEQQHGEVFYLDAQLELLRQMAGFLRQNQPLPAYLLRTYIGSGHEVRFFYPRSLGQDCLAMLRRLGRQAAQTWHVAIGLLWVPNKKPSRSGEGFL